jgi:hypothetical protein
MLSKQMKNQFKLWGTAVLIFYVVCFAFLVIHNFQVWTLSPFIESLIGVFMGAGAIAVITGVILIFQSAIQAEQEKKQKVFDKKMNLYQSIITEMNEKIKVRKGEKYSMITPEERLELFFTQLNIALLSKPKTFRLFSEMLNDISDEEGKITDDAPKKLLRFIQEARKDLDVQEPMTAEDIADFSVAVKIAEKEAKNLSKPYQKTVFNDIDGMIKHLNEKSKISEKTEEMLRYIYNVLKSNASQNITFKFSPSFLGIKKDGNNYIVIKTGKSFVDINRSGDEKDVKYLEKYGLEIKPQSDKRWKSYFVRFKELSEFKQCQDEIVNYMNS